MAEKSVRVLVVDDSHYMRFVIAKILKEAQGIEVVGDARDGADALVRLEELRPDVVTLDFEMPRMNGLETLAEIMRRRPTPVVMVSTHTGAGADVTIKALEAGAVDFVQKPEGRDALTFAGASEELIRKILSASKANLGAAATAPAPPLESPPGGRSPVKASDSVDKIIVIGSSTGGPRALVSVMSRIPGDIRAGIYIVQHMPQGFTSALAARLDNVSAVSVSEAKEGERLTAGRALLAPGGLHMRILKNGRVHLTDEAQVNGVRPAVDLTMQDAAKVFGNIVIGAILTGMGADGTKGCEMIKKHNGATIAQLGSTCVVDGMPSSVVNAGFADSVVHIDQIAGKLAELAGRKAPA